MTLKSIIALVLTFGAFALTAPPFAQASEAEAHAVVRRRCLPPNETRQEIKARHFLEPFAVLKSASAQFKAEALSAKLCHFGDEFVYEITLLQRGGRLVHAVMSATSGKLLGARNAHGPVPKM